MDKILIETPQCIIRFLEESDYERFVAGYQQCLPALNRFDEGRIDTAFMTRKWYADLLLRRKSEAECDYSYMFNVFSKDNSSSIGYCDITTLFREDLQLAKIGYTVFNNYWRRGIGTEIVGAICSIGFHVLKFHRLEAHINLDNPASKAVVRKNAFQFEGIRKQFILENGVWTDNEIYYKLADV